MSDEIKAGDLVMIVKPTACCGSALSIGQIYKTDLLSVGRGKCTTCGHVSVALQAQDPADGYWCEVSRLIKIDPPAEGDSLPACAELPIKELA